MIFKRENPNPAEFNSEVDILLQQQRQRDEENQVPVNGNTIVTPEMIKDAEFLAENDARRAGDKHNFDAPQIRKGTL